MKAKVNSSTGTAAFAKAHDSRIEAPDKAITWFEELTAGPAVDMALSVAVPHRRDEHGP
jgi:hypothetical protein